MKNSNVEILTHKVGVGCPCFIIGEIGLNHNGELSVAKELIRVAARAGCNAVKFQKRNVDTLAIASVLDAKDDRFSSFGSTYREIRDHLEFNFDQYKELIDEVSKNNISFLCTAFDIESVDFLEKLGVNAYKFASHSLTNIPLLEYAAKVGKPIVLSTGMATLEEVDRGVNVFKSNNVPLILLHCVSAYPQQIDESNLVLMDKYRECYQIPIGYSGHEIGWLPTLSAVARGACLVERHITLDNKMVGFDHKLSLMPDELTNMVKDIRAIESTLGSEEKFVSEREQVTRDKYHVSWVAKVEIPKGVIISEDMLTLKNPGTGIPACRKGLILGRRAVIEISQDVLIQPDMLGK